MDFKTTSLQEKFQAEYLKLLETKNAEMSGGRCVVDGRRINTK